MKQTLLALSLALFISCGPNKTKDNENTGSTDIVTDYLLQGNSISKLLATKHQQLAGIKGDLKSFKLFLNSLPVDSLTSIPFALDYVNSCISTNDANRDSIFFLFNMKFYAVTNTLADSLDTKYKFLVDQLEKDANTVELRYFKDNLATCGIDILSTEGMYYLDVTSDFFFNNFKDRVSDDVAEYLKIRKNELEQGFSEDAGMLITFEELYQRIKQWERFINKYPNTFYNTEANSYYETYIETLMTGMDNSRVFDFDENLLSPEIKTLYEKIIKEESESRTTKIISSYYTFLERHGFKENDSIEVFLKANNLSTMLAVQPFTR